MRSKAYMSQINLQHGTTTNSGEQEVYRVKTDMLRSIGKQSGNPWSQSGRRKGRQWWNGFAEKEGFKPSSSLSPLHIQIQSFS